MNNAAPLPVIPYANVMGYDRVRLLRHALRHSIAAFALTAFYVPAWLAGRTYFGCQISYAWGTPAELINHFVPLIQAILLGAGLALTFAARDAGGLRHSRLKYLLAFTLNLLAFTSLVLNEEGVMDRPRVISRWISLSQDI